jgi:hypothetical protein
MLFLPLVCKNTFLEQFLRDEVTVGYAPQAADFQDKPAAVTQIVVILATTPVPRVNAKHHQVCLPSASPDIPL